jgi:dUTP pyrophosphatase
MHTFEFARKMEDGKPVAYEATFKNSFVVNEPAYPDADLPEYTTKDLTVVDFFCAEDTTIKPVNELLKPTYAHTGVKVKMGSDEVLQLFTSSSLDDFGPIISRGIEVVDSEYYDNNENDGEITFALYNLGNEDITIHKGDKIGRGVFVKTSGSKQK